VPRFDVGRFSFVTRVSQAVAPHWLSRPSVILSNFSGLECSGDHNYRRGHNPSDRKKERTAAVLRKHNEIVPVSVAPHRRIARATQSHMRYCDPVTSKGCQALGYRPPEEFKQVAEQRAVSIGALCAKMSFSSIRRSFDPM
jgi:hypothetical protein